MSKISCYNRGCGQDYDPNNNPDGEQTNLPLNLFFWFSVGPGAVFACNGCGWNREDDTTTRSQCTTPRMNTNSHWERLCLSSWMFWKNFASTRCPRQQTDSFHCSLSANTISRCLPTPSGHTIFPRCVQRMVLLQKEKCWLHRIPKHQRMWTVEAFKRQTSRTRKAGAEHCWRRASARDPRPH